jgi:hypothetical protein
MAPLSVTYDYEISTEEEFKFCYRDPKTSDPGPFAWTACESTLKEMMDFMAWQLQKNGPRFFAHFLIDVLWGWERYLAQIRNDISGVAQLQTWNAYVRSC